MCDWNEHCSITSRAGTCVHVFMGKVPEVNDLANLVCATCCVVSNVLTLAVSVSLP